MNYWNINTFKQFLASIIWNASEWSGIGLGRLAPYVFHIMIGAKKMKKQDKELNPKQHE